MAERDSDSVRRVVRLRHGLQGKDAAHHVHDLLFVRTAVTDDRLLDLQRRVFIDLQPGLIAREQDDAAAMPVVIFVLKNSSSTAITSG